MMSSIIPGYNYDIFISYRQKDNKYDGWVTEFVDNLKRELEATFKEEVSVYFDINPHDGLLETHDVDASLAEKLKCVVFIPVISRTYCDPKSFAWEHEFKAFVELASKDKCGLKIRLPSGNVANRVLPVRIHDLELPDIRLVESLLGGVIRGVDFIYKEPGVNRPLTPDDDDHRNQTGAKYRNQINKTANAIKEIISGLMPGPAGSEKPKDIGREVWEEINAGSPGHESHLKGWSGFKNFGKITRWLVFITLLIAGVVVIIKSGKFPGASRTLTVFYSTGSGNDTTLKNICEIFTEYNHRDFKLFKNLTLTARSALLRYRESPVVPEKIWNDLKNDYLLWGAVRREKEKIRIDVELTERKNNKELWYGVYSWNKDSITRNTAEIARAVAKTLRIKLSPGQIRQLESEPTRSAEANINYSLGNSNSYYAGLSFNMGNMSLKSVSYISAIEAYDRAIKEDSLFALAYLHRAMARAWAYYTKQIDSAEMIKCVDDISIASRINSELPEIKMAQGFYYYYCLKQYQESLKYFEDAARKNPGDYLPLFQIAMVYRRMGDWKSTFRWLRKIIELDPQEALYLTNIGMTYTYFHKYDSALLYHQKAIDALPEWNASYYNKIEALLLKNGNTAEARSLLDTAIKKTGFLFMENKILLDLYDRRFTSALAEAKRAHKEDFNIRGKKFLYSGLAYSYLKDRTNAAAYYDSAIVSFREALSSDRNNYEIHSCLGLALAGRGEKEEAINEGKAAVDLVPYNNFDKSDMILELARIYTLLGEYDLSASTLIYFLQSPENIPACISGNLLKLDPVWNPLISQPKFRTSLNKYLNN